MNYGFKFRNYKELLGTDFKNLGIGVLGSLFKVLVIEHNRPEGVYLKGNFLKSRGKSDDRVLLNGRGVPHKRGKVGSGSRNRGLGLSLDPFLFI